MSTDLVPSDVPGLQGLIHDAAQLSSKYDDLARAWAAEQPEIRERDDPRWEWRGWLGFCVLSAHVVGFADPPSLKEVDHLLPACLLHPLQHRRTRPGGLCRSTISSVEIG